MNSPERQPDEGVRKPVPKTALVVMLIVVVGLALVSLFANFQRLRRDKIEEVIITPAASPTASTP
jgi:LPS O-antigen subunit length determinant protein (WzzB/FepE family)